MSVYTSYTAGKHNVYGETSCAIFIYHSLRAMKGLQNGSIWLVSRLASRQLIYAKSMLQPGIIWFIPNNKNTIVAYWFLVSCAHKASLLSWRLCRTSRQTRRYQCWKNTLWSSVMCWTFCSNSSFRPLLSDVPSSTHLYIHTCALIGITSRVKAFN